MKKTFCVFLASLMLALTFVPFAFAVDPYPESAHNYENNTHQTWTYTHPSTVAGLYVTFSSNTEFDAGELWFLDENFTESQLEEYAENGFVQTGDFLSIYDGNGSLYGRFTGNWLSGERIYLSGNSFTLTLDSDEEGTAYGFRITRISPVMDKYALLNYHLGDEVTALVSEDGDIIHLPGAYKMLQDGHRMIIGWKTADGASYYYDNTITPYVYDEETDEYHYDHDIAAAIDATDITAQSKAVYDFYPIYAPLKMAKDEVFSFVNSSSVFNADIEEGYLYKPEHLRQFCKDWIATFGLSPLMPVAAAGLTFFMTVWPTQEFDGSCCGFPVATMLQYYGKLDLLSRQGVSKVSELQPDEELQSIVNFYNNQCVAAHVTNHNAIERGTAEYRAQLKKLYETLQDGTPVYFEFYPGAQHPLKTSSIEDIQGFTTSGAHSILLTGAYTDGKGNHVLIGWDNRSSCYANGTCDILYIDNGFNDVIERCYYDKNTFYVLDGFSWNEDISVYDSFKVEGTPNPLAWHKAFFKNLKSLLQQLFDLFWQRLKDKF